MISKPHLVAHADWSVEPAKRWLARAILGRDGRYRASPPEPVGRLDHLLRRLASDGLPVLLGLDFPIGLPLAYAERAGIEAFRTALPGFGTGRWRHFYDVASAPDQISLHRPFFPDRPGERGRYSRHQLVEKLGLGDPSELWRRCERRTALRTAACPLFWTLGPNQVGKAAITGWRDLLAPALPRDLAIWPFEGAIEDLLTHRHIIVAETYPAEIYIHLGLDLRRHGGKRRQIARQANAARLLDRAKRTGIVLTSDLRAMIRNGFGTGPSGEDRFDSLVGLFGMLDVVLGHRPAGEPVDPLIRRIEGWILGQQP